MDEFIRNIKKYIYAPELTREMCYEFIDRVIVGGLPKITGKDRTIEIVYKVDRRWYSHTGYCARKKNKCMG